MATGNQKERRPQGVHGTGDDDAVWVHMRPYDPSNTMLDPGMVVHTCNDNTEGAEGKE